jgi:hypothetical protein
MQGTELANYVEHALYQVIAFEVAQLPQGDRAAQVIVFVCVTPRTAQWTFACDFNR